MTDHQVSCFLGIWPGEMRSVFCKQSPQHRGSPIAVCLFTEVLNPKLDADGVSGNSSIFVKLTLNAGFIWDVSTG